MKKVVSTEKLPIKMWLEDLEEGALDQAKNLANLPFAYKHIPIMPDSHQGYGMPIGSILATKGVIVPNAVGVDIGCGMCALRTDLTEMNKENVEEVLHIAKRMIPVGFNSHDKPQLTMYMPQKGDPFEYDIIGDNANKALYQLGTLGGGNHFIEIQKGSDGFIWIMIHSGSRALGFAVAKHYNKVAEDLNESYASTVTKDQGLAFLPFKTDEAREYFAEMKYCVEYALCNRRLMMDRMVSAMRRVVGSFDVGELINKSHNFAAFESHYGENVIVHRKGATRAYEGELGMIPGSQGSNSYIVRGKGSPNSFKSCSHGAGRKIGRKQAIRELDFEAEVKHLEEMGVVHSLKTYKDLDEATGSYKDITEVMGNQTDLVDVVVELTPLGVLKG